MKIEIIKATVCDGQKVCAGDVLETSIDAAKLLMGIGKAVEYIEKPKPKRTSKKQIRLDG